MLIGFPQDEGVRRNRGRAGAADAPAEIRRWLYRLAAADAESDADLTVLPPVDLGDVVMGGDLEETQESLAMVVAAVLRTGAVPVVLGGGHETAYGHYLGYVAAGAPVGIVNLDAHLDVRPLIDGRGHSGSSFRQAMEHFSNPLPGQHYVCLGAQPHATSRAHRDWAKDQGCTIRWRNELQPALAHHLAIEIDRIARAECRAYVSVDADVVRMADVPGVSAPDPAGLDGNEVLAAVRLAGRVPVVASLDVVEVNPRVDPDGRSTRWAALAVWNFLVGLAERWRAPPDAL